MVDSLRIKLWNVGCIKFLEEEIGPREVLEKSVMLNVLNTILQVTVSLGQISS